MTLHKPSLPQVAATALVVLALALAVAPADQPAPARAPKIGIIDSEKVLRTSQVGKQALAEITKLQKEKEAEGKAKMKEITDLQEKITKERASLPEDKLTELAKQLETKQIAMRQFANDASRDFNKHRTETLAKIDAKVMPAIAQVGKEMGYTAIFRRYDSGLLYFDEAIDITNVIIERMDAATAK